MIRTTGMVVKRLTGAILIGSLAGLGMVVGVGGVGGCAQQQQSSARPSVLSSESRQTYSTPCDSSVTIKSVSMPTSTDKGSATASHKTAVVWVKGLSCPRCAQSIKKELTALPGVVDVDIDYAQENAAVTLAAKHPATRSSIEKAVERSGYSLTKLEMP